MLEAFLFVPFGPFGELFLWAQQEEVIILPCFYFCSVEPGFWIPRRRVLLHGILVGTIVPSKQIGRIVAKIWVQDVIFNKGNSHSLPRSYEEESGKFNASLYICKKTDLSA